MPSPILQCTLLRLIGTGLTPEEAADLVLYLSLAENADAREVGDLVRRSMLEPFPRVDLTDDQRAAVREAIETAPPERLEWAKRRLLRG